MKQTKKSLYVFVAVALSLSAILFVSCTECEPKKREIPDTPFTKELNARNHRISKERAIELLRTYDANSGALLSGQFRGDSLILPFSETFNLRAADSLLSQPGIAGVRAYLSMDPATKKLKLILVGVNSAGRDVLQNSRRGGAMAFSGDDSLGYILDDTHRDP
jgi:hypothetical protein